jgi:hypothetical protein
LLGDLGAALLDDSFLSAGPMSPLYVAPERLVDCTWRLMCTAWE